MRRNQKGFTLMELMVVIVIVAILAAVAVPLYINYVKDARRTEAKAAIGALATAMEEYYLKVGTYANAHTDLFPANPGDPRNSNLDATTVQEIEQHWTINVSNSGGTTGYTINLTGKAGTPYAQLGVQYVYLRGTGGTLTDVDNP
jgi:type II secretion system protein G